MLKDVLIFTGLYVIFHKVESSVQIPFKTEDNSKVIIFPIIHQFLIQFLLDLYLKKVFDLLSRLYDEFTLFQDQYCQMGAQPFLCFNKYPLKLLMQLFYCQRIANFFQNSKQQKNLHFLGYLCFNSSNLLSQSLIKPFQYLFQNYFDTQPLQYSLILTQYFSHSKFAIFANHFKYRFQYGIILSQFDDDESDAFDFKYFAKAAVFMAIEYVYFQMFFWIQRIWFDLAGFCPFQLFSFSNQYQNLYYYTNFINHPQLFILLFLKVDKFHKENLLIAHFHDSQQQIYDFCVIQILLKLLSSINSMDKDIEMFQISDKEPQIGTQIFDANLPSNIDFDESLHQNIEKLPMNPQKIARLSKGIVIGDQMKSYRIVGKASAFQQPRFFKGALVNSHIHTFGAKLFDQVSSGGIKKFWESIVGYSKRQICIQGGHIYFFQPRKEGRFLYQLLKLSTLFKIFIDSEQDKIRLIFNEGGRMLTKDISPQKYLPFIDHLLQQLSKIGLGVEE